MILSLLTRIVDRIAYVCVHTEEQCWSAVVSNLICQVLIGATMHGWVQFGAPPDDEENFQRGRCIQLLNSVTKQTYSTLPEHTHLVPNNYASANFDLCLQFENEQFRWLPKKDGGWHGDDRVTEIGSVIACASLYPCAHCCTMLTMLYYAHCLTILPMLTMLYYAHCLTILPMLAVLPISLPHRTETQIYTKKHKTGIPTTSASCLAAS